MPNSKAMLGILYVLLNGIPWNALSKEYSSGPSCWRRLRGWQRKGVWKRVWKEMLDRAEPDMKLAMIDSSSVQAPRGGSTGPNPTDRAKKGVKRHVIANSRATRRTIRSH